VPEPTEVDPSVELSDSPKPETPPTPSQVPDGCEEVQQGTELTAQAVGLIALGVLAAGSVLALPIAALRRRRP
jgi:hypothetical protein